MNPADLAPYIEIPHLTDYRLVELAVKAEAGRTRLVQQAMRRTTRRCHHVLYRELRFEVSDNPNAVDHYAILDLEVLGARHYGRQLVDWISLANLNEVDYARLGRILPDGHAGVCRGISTSHGLAEAGLIADPAADRSVSGWHVALDQ